MKLDPKSISRSLGHFANAVKMSKCVVCLNWFCFCVYYKGLSGYSTIGSRPVSSTGSMSDKLDSKVEFTALENGSKLKTNVNNEKTAAMVSQAEIWQEEKKFAVHVYIFSHYKKLLFTFVLFNLFPGL